MTSLQELIFKSPDPMDAVMKLGKAIAESRMFGAGSAMQGVIIVTHCLDKGIALLDWVAEYHLMDVGGKVTPTMKADAMLARFEANGGTFVWDNDGTDGKEAVLTLRKGDRQQTIRYTIEDARTAKLIKPDGNWVKNAPAMLRARVTSSGLTMFNPSIKVGTYTPEELEEIGSTGAMETVSTESSATATVQQQAPQDSDAGKSGRGRPKGSKNKETGAAEGAGAPAVQAGTAADSKTTETAAAPSVVNDAPTTPASTVAANAPSNEATTAVDESRFAQVQWLEREKAKFFSLTHEKLIALGVPEGDTKTISLDEQRWAAGITSKTSSAVIAEMTQDELDGLETLFKTREERLKPFTDGKDMEAFLNSVIAGK